MLSRLRSFLTALTRRERFEDGLDAEVRFHLESYTEDLTRSGVPKAEAARRARVHFGCIESMKDDCRHARGLRLTDELRQDVRYAIRGLRRSALFASIAIASLALGIGANTAIFSFVDAILLQRLPVDEPERLVTFAQTHRGERTGVVWPLRTIDALDEGTPAFAGVFGWFSRPINLSTGDDGRWINGELVTGRYYSTLRVAPAAGRLLNDDDVRNAIADPVCVISYGLWQRAFGGDPGAIGETVLLNGYGYRVLGVTARGFHGAELNRRFDVGVPATRIGDFLPAFGGASGVERMNTMSWLVPMARLGTGVARVEAERQARLALQQIDPERQDQLRLEDGTQGFNTIRPEFGQPVLVSMSVVGLVLLAACANLSNLLLARAQARSHELGLRRSLGASRARLVRQLLVETSVLAIAGGLGGVALSTWIRDTLLALLNAGRPAASTVQVTADVQVLAFAALLTCATAILCAAAPAWQATRPDLAAGLKREPAASASGSRTVLPRALIVAQVAVCLVVVFGAGLLTQTLRTLSTVDLGFNPDKVIALLPGVTTASLATNPPHGAMSFTMGIEVPGYIPARVRGDTVVSFNFISSRYFETLGQPVIRGRDFDERDGRGRPLVAIVNETFVEHFFDGRDPVGRRFRHGTEEVAIVGMVADSRDQAIRTGPADTVYMPVKQGPPSAMTLLARAGDDPERAVPSLLAMVGSIDRRMPVISVHTLDVDVESGISSERMLGYLSTLFAALTLLLAGIGLYGLLASAVVRRRREIGLRIALGARSRDVAVLFGRESAALVFAGVTVGALLAFACARILRGVLFGVAPNDPLTMVASVSVLTVVALLATAMPLRRAVRVDPMVALRSE